MVIIRKIHASAIVDKGAIIGNGTSIWQNCIIQNDVIIGSNCNIGANVYIESGVRIGNGVKIKNNVAIYTGVVIEDDVFIGPSCVFTNVINPRAFISRKNEFKNTIIKKGASLGANSTIICGNTIGQYAMVGAGSVVTHYVDAYSLEIGNPSRFYRYVCRCGCQLDDRLICKNCGIEYMKDNKTIQPKGDATKEGKDI